MYVIAVGILINFGWIFLASRVTEFGGDTPFYLALGEQLAKPNPNFQNPVSFWPDKPATDRAPGWPFVISLAIRIFPEADRVFLVQATGAVVSIANAVLIAVLTFQLTGSRRLATLAGLAWDLNPVALSFVDTGGSEPLFVFLAALACVGIIRGGGHLYWAALALGLSCHVRQFFALFPFCILALVVLRRLTWRGSPSPFTSRELVLGGLIFMAPVVAWCYRNYTVTGHAPVLSTLRGETFYGSNNPVVANELLAWGYWIMPDEIPGEARKADLARTMTAFEVDRYYFQKGMQYLRSNWFALPRHLVGKLVRGYVPVPWVPIWQSYISFSFRILIYVLFVSTLGSALRDCRPSYRITLEAMLLVSLITTLIFYGNYRFTYCVEPFLVPMIAVGLRGRDRAETEPAEKMAAVV